MNALVDRDLRDAIRLAEEARACTNPTEALGYIYRALGRLQSAAQTADLVAEQSERLKATGQEVKR